MRYTVQYCVMERGDSRPEKVTGSLYIAQAQADVLNIKAELDREQKISRNTGLDLRTSTMVCGWLPHGTATQATAHAYHQRLAGKYPRVVLRDGRWVRVRSEAQPTPQPDVT